jgi:ABC-type iron transport system FetAB permease component
MKPFLKYAYLPLAILVITAAGSIFAEVNNFLLFESKYNFSQTVISWFSFAVNASVLFGVLPSYLYRKYGPRKTMILGGLLLTGAHVGAALMLGSTKSD